MYFLGINLQMPGVTVKDVCPHKFVTAFAEYLKQSGKIEVWLFLDIALKVAEL